MTTTTKHTPGPWKIDTYHEIDPKYQISLGQEWSVIGLRDPEDGCIDGVIAMCHPDNARLIAAAPELLEACKRLLGRIEHHTAEVESCDLCSSDEIAMDEARAAIAKAEGTA